MDDGAQSALIVGQAGALPPTWENSWGRPDSSVYAEITAIREGIEALAADLVFSDKSALFSNLVHSSDLRNHPIHRWYYYKEGFSPLLPAQLVQALGVGVNGIVADSFAGVGTTALSLRQHPKIKQVIGIEYSPFAAFVGSTKLAAISLDVESLQRQFERLQHARLPSKTPAAPQLSAFNNPAIFPRDTLRRLISFRELVRRDDSLADDERNLFLLGIAAVMEDLSNVMKDGRALRILKGRNRRRQGLRPLVGALDETGVRATIINQWRAMIEDVEHLADQQATAQLSHIRGDARAITSLRDNRAKRLIPDNSVGLYLYSPPYLNFLDYSEVYKLELWFLELVTDQASFRILREGTLRSHPSIQFPERPRVDDASKAFSVIDAITSFLTANLSRPSIGPVPGQYFADMYEVLKEQLRTLEPGGSIACVVANSTLSRRTKDKQGRKEIWRMPILTDVILARLAEAAGFVDVQIWGARSIQAKNVEGGHARESIVIAKKAKA